MADMGNKMIAVVLGIVVAGLMLGYVFPVGLDAVNEDPTYTLTQDEGVEVQVQERLNSTAVTVDDSANTVELQLKDTETGTTETQTLGVGGTDTYSTLEGGDVNVSVDSIDSSTSATITYEVEKGFAWDNSSQTIFQILGLFLVIVPLVALAKMAMQA